ncbi:MAG: diguanylate cyclase [Phycisphaerae bacterium]
MAKSNPSLLFFEVRTILCLMSGIALLLAATHLYAWLLRRRDRWLGFWGIGNLMASIGLALASLRGYAPYVLTVSLSQTAVLMGLFLNWIGLRSFNEKRPLKPWVWLVFPLIFVLLELQSPISSTMAHRITLVASLLSLTAVMMIRELMSILKKSNLKVTRFLMVLFSLFVVGNVIRIAAMWLHPANHLTRLPSPVVGLTLAGTLGLLAAWNMGFLMLASERLQNALMVAANTDGLTGVLNRNAFEAAVRRQLLLNKSRLTSAPAAGPVVGRGEGDGQSDALLIIDIDEFKQVNEQYGHEAGDALLRLFAATAQSSLRSSDSLGRRGGDEFTIFLKGVDEAGATRIAERLRRGFAHGSESDPQIGRAATLSIGVMMIKPGDESLDALLMRADAAMYQAKGQGKDRIMVA